MGRSQGASCLLLRSHGGFNYHWLASQCWIEGSFSHCLLFLCEGWFSLSGWSPSQKIDHLGSLRGHLHPPSVECFPTFIYLPHTFWLSFPSLHNCLVTENWLIQDHFLWIFSYVLPPAWQSLYLWSFFSGDIYIPVHILGFLKISSYIYCT